MVLAFILQHPLNRQKKGFIDKQTLIRELKTYKLVDQFLFHTEKALKSLTYIESKEVKL